MELEIHGSKKYLKGYLKNHLEHEHPKTKGHMELSEDKKRKSHKTHKLSLNVFS